MRPTRGRLMSPEVLMRIGLLEISSVWRDRMVISSLGPRIYCGERLADGRLPCTAVPGAGAWAKAGIAYVKKTSVLRRLSGRIVVTPFFLATTTSSTIAFTTGLQLYRVTIS